MRAMLEVMECNSFLHNIQVKLVYSLFLRTKMQWDLAPSYDLTLSIFHASASTIQVPSSDVYLDKPLSPSFSQYSLFFFLFNRRD